MRGEDHLVQPRAPRPPRSFSPPTVANRLSFLPTLAPRVGSAAAAAAASAAVSHVDLASVAPKMTRVWPPKPVAMGPGCATVTETPRSATSPRSEWQNADSAALVAA